MKKNKIILDLTFKVYNQMETIAALQQRLSDALNAYNELDIERSDALMERNELRDYVHKLENPPTPEPELCDVEALAALREKLAGKATPTKTAPKRKRTGNTSWKTIINRLLEEPAGTKVHVRNAPSRSSALKAIGKYQLQFEYKNDELYVWYPANSAPDSGESGV